MINKIKKLFKKYEEIIWYLVIGVLTTVVNFVIYYLVTVSFLNPNNKLELQVAEVLAWIGAVVFAYFTNRKYVFKKKNKANLSEGIEFASFRVVTLLIEMALMFVFVSLLKYNDRIMKIVIQFVVIILNYVFSKFFVFKKTK